MLEILRSSIPNDFNRARLQGVGLVHYREEAGVLKPANILEAVHFVNDHFDSERGDLVLLEGRLPGERFRGPIDEYPFAEHVVGDGWDNKELLDDALHILKIETDVINKLIEAQTTDDLSMAEEWLGKWDIIHPIFVDQSIRKRNEQAGIPRVKRAFAEMESTGHYQGHVLYLAGQAHITEDENFYRALEGISYTMRGDKKAPYLNLRRSNSSRRG